MQVKKISYGLKKLTSAIKASHLAYAGLLVGQVVSQSAQAAPEGGVVVGGDGSITAQDLTTIIDQKTDLLAIDWDSFNLTEEELVRFLQPDSSSIVLNRILDQNPSTIRGAIESNGHVILANPRGVLFTETATVNVGAITAAGLDMDSSEFMSGNFSFQGENGSAGVVVNRGVINASSAVLVGKQVTNAASGLISAEIVSLAAADEAVLTFDADGMIGVKITKEVMENQLGVDSAVLNEGAIDGAQVLMEAKVSGDLFSSAVNNKGTVRARGIDTSGGKIRLFGGGAEVVNSGALDASGTYGGEVEIEGDSVEHRGVVSVRGDAGAGGSVRVLGDEVVVSGAIDARGIGGGGEILVGGDYQGKNAEIRNANKTTVAADAVIDASGIGNGDGGKVIVWADGGTHFAGVVRAESGELGGDGGFVETSGKVNLYLGEDSMFVSTLSHGRGETGEWLLDPGWLDIADSCSTNCISTAALEGALSSNNVTITVTDADTASGLAVVDDGDPATDYADGIRVSDNLDWNTTNALTLDSFSDVEIGNGVVITASDADLVVIAGGSFTSEGSVSVNSFSLNVGGNGADSTNSLGSVTATSGTVTGGTGLDVFTLSSADDSVVVDGDLQFTLGANIVFSAVEMLDTGSGTDIVTGADGAGWALKGAGQAESSGITFIGADELFAASAGLTGTAGDDSFVLTAIGDVVVDGLTFKNLSDVNGSTGNDTVDASNFVAGLTLTGTNKEISADTLLFSDIENGVASLLTGSSGADLFSIVADNTVDIAGIRVSGLNTVNADLGSDDVIASGPVTLTGNSGEASTAAIDFSGIDTVTAGSLIGSDNNDTFVITGPNAVTAYDIAFSGISSIDTKLGSDSVTGASGIDWVLTAGIDEAENSGITFTGVETLIADLAGLIGSASDENYTLEDNGDVVVSSLTFQSLTAVDAGGGSDTISLASNTNATLNGTDGEASIRGLDFSNIESVTSATLVGSDAGDRYLVTGADSIVANAIAFAGISSVTAGSGDDTATGLNGEDWSLNGSGGAVNNGITFANVETFVADAAGLVGTASDESYTLENDGDVVVGGLIFRSLTGVDAAGGSDTIALISLADATLNGTDGEASIRGLDFS
ncbi:filamentous hemagglutinin N-terminal domain-containing protein, partial [Microbulbifer marinus]